MDRLPVDSSLIRAIGYDFPNSVLEVELVANERIYHYFDVPLSIYNELMATDSKGPYFNESIRDLYPFEEIDSWSLRRMAEAEKGLDTPGTIDRDRHPSKPGGVPLIDWSAAFDEGLPYVDFLDKYANPNQRGRWDAMHARIHLDDDQVALLGGFVREMPVLVLNGAWCGDCINQVTIFDHFARACPKLNLRLLDRDALAGVRDALAINGGYRVPVAVFLSEDYQEVARYGERTLSTYRRKAIEQLGPSCPTGLVAPDDDATRFVTREWLNEFERAQLLLRLSPRLRERHGD